MGVTGAPLDLTTFPRVRSMTLNFLIVVEYVYWHRLITLAAYFRLLLQIRPSALATPYHRQKT